MADPLPLADFFDGLRVDLGVKFYLPGVRSHSRTGSGDVLSAVLGHQLWHGQVNLTPGRPRDIASVQAQFEELDRAGDPFLIHPFPCGPAHDPDGSIIAGHSPVIFALPSDSSQIQIEGLPVGYRLSRGDFLSFPYGSTPLRYGLHRILTPEAVAGSLGRATVKVSPHIRPGAAVGSPVTLYKPVCKAVIEPGSIQWPDYGSVVAGTISFRFIQTLR